MSSYDGDGLSFMSCPNASYKYQGKPTVVKGKKLCSLLSTDENYKVFLRIKPTGEKNKTHLLVDNETLVTEVPRESVSYKVLSRKNISQFKKKFKFTSILEEASQKETFEKCALPALKCFLQGENCFLMAFGTTSAGKTFTMQGSAENPGVIPRAISYIFRCLDGLIEHSDRIQPYRGTQLLELTESKYQQELSFKNRILSLDLAKYKNAIDSSYMSFRSYKDDETFYSVEFKSMEENIELEESFQVIFGDRFSVWVSMIEIYNENIVDLLQFHNDQVERPYLNLGEDDRGGFYVKNATYIPVRNGHEAYQVNQFGRTNLHRAPTALNDKSSRSHCIFTLTLVRHQEDGVCLHRLSFVDLAGSERVKKTLNDGKRLVESNSINKSLSVLGKCLNALKDNQNSKIKQIVPVRDSKITKLTKNALVGFEKLIFIINITPNPNLFDETMHVLKFSALAQEIVPDSKQSMRSTTRFSQIFHSTKCEPSFACSAASSVSDLSERPDDISRKQLMAAESRFRIAEQREEELLIELADLKSQLTESKEAALKLSQILTNTKEENQIMRSNVMQNFEEAMQAKVKYYSEEIEIMKKEWQKDKDDEIDYLMKQIDHLKNEMRRVKKKYSEPISTINELKDENERLKNRLEGRQTLLDEAFQDYDAIIAQNEKLKGEIARHIILIEQLSDDLEESQCQSEEFNAEINLLNAQLMALTKLEERLKLEISEQQTKINSLTELLDKSKDKLIEQQTIIDSLTMLLQKKTEDDSEEKLKAQLIEQNGEIKTLKELLENTTANEEESNKRFKEYEELLTEKQAKIDSLTALLDTKKDIEETRLKEISANEEKLKEKITEQQRKINELKETLEEKIKFEEDITARFKENSDIVLTLREQLSEQEAQIKTLNESTIERTNIDEVLATKIRETNSIAINHEIALREELEKENQCLKKSVKESCTKEMSLREENISLKAAIRALEQEAVRNNLKDVEKLTEHIKQLELKNKCEQNSITGFKDEIKQLNDKLIAQQIENNNSKKLLELEIQSAHKKLETSEYQRKVYLTMKERADEEAKIIPELRDVNERLENELINKNQEMDAFESRRNFLLLKSEREIKQYQDEIERLKKDVQFGHAVVIENLRNSEKKDEIKRLQDELHNKNMKLMLLERKSNDRSPFKNFTNFVPTGNLVDVSPYIPRNLRLSKSHENISLLDKTSYSLTKSESLEYLCKDGELKTPIKAYPSDKENINSCLFKTGERDKILTPSSMMNCGGGTSSNEVVKFSLDNDNMENKMSPVAPSNSVRKTRTAKKRDPREHPALGKSAKKSTCVSLSPIPPPRSVKKQLFSNNDFVELSDDSDFLPPPSPHQPKRTLRPRNKRKCLDF